jgi:MFS family permease
MGILNGVGGALGSITGGALGDRWFRTNPKAHVTLCALGALAIVPFHMATLLAPTLWLALAAWAGALFFQFFYVGPMWATIQGLAPPGGRATAGAIHLMFANLVGLGVGPLLVGFVSDLLSVRFALGPNDGLRFALVVLELVAIATAALFWACRRYVARDLANPIGQEVAAFHGATPASA